MSEDRMRPVNLARILSTGGGRAPDWNHPSHGDPAMLVGSSRALFLHWLALLVAAGADVGAFTQVIGLVMRDQDDWLIWLVVFGFTAVVLYLAHNTGVLLRNARVRRGSDGVLRRAGGWVSRRVGAYLCMAVWVGLGLVAYWVRLTVPPVQEVTLGGSGPLGGGSVSLGGGVPPSRGTGRDLYEEQAAALFLALYAATGVVAAVGAYLTHHPLRLRYMAAVRAHRKAVERAAASAYQLTRAEAVRNSQAVEIGSADRLRDQTERELCALAERLKQTARVAMAGAAQDPAVTDAIFREDDRPYAGGGPCVGPRRSSGASGDGDGVDGRPSNGHGPATGPGRPPFTDTDPGVPQP
ncbi:hypothetical protein [Sphaerisporangium sp. TRM90804]|uniref:hypothetical protein n=1 Tax=Sphaerisporangium sp. TRM90804 TaxID=3031113 RepID=UPI002446FF02|nr:hypothetical protein [Sphaerisporangium sp. TRM90804]MDH2430330.1 hypothetical protein [Sphaerisporangium sp. TRM90804]